MTQASETANRDRRHHCGEPETLLAGITDPANPRTPPADDGSHERDEENQMRDVDHPGAPVTRGGVREWARAQPGRYHQLGRRGQGG